MKLGGMSVHANPSDQVCDISREWDEDWDEDVHAVAMEHPY